MAKITMVGGGQFAELEKLTKRLRNNIAIDAEVLRCIQSLHPTAAEAAARIQEFARSMGSIKYPQLKRHYEWCAAHYQSQSAELRHATQLEF